MENKVNWEICIIRASDQQKKKKQEHATHKCKWIKWVHVSFFFSLDVWAGLMTQSQTTNA